MERRRGFQGLKPPPQRGSGWQLQSKQASWAKAESRKDRQVWRLEFPVPFFPFEDELLPLPMPVWGNSPGIQITAANAERAQWKAPCERTKSLIHLKTWQILWNNPLEQVWLIGRDAGILHSMFWMCPVAVHFSIKLLCQDSLAAEAGISLSDRSFLCFCCHFHTAKWWSCSCWSLWLLVWNSE